jgi:CheY-like chemotaxis protein
VLTASSAKEGLAFAARERPVVILTDLRFPDGMNGLEATRLLKADPTTADIPVMALTALGQPQVQLEARDAVFAAYVAKLLARTPHCARRLPMLRTLVDVAIFTAVIPAVGGLVLLISGLAIAGSLAVLPYCLGCAVWEVARSR